MTTSIQLDEPLRKLLRARREQASLTQKQAAHAAGFSHSWWRRAEKGYEPYIPLPTIARMLSAVRAPAALLAELGYPSVAAEVAERARFTGDGHQLWDRTERHLWETPGASETARKALVSFWRAYQEVESMKEPYGQEIARLALRNREQ